jgi:hypothetical protein
LKYASVYYLYANIQMKKPLTPLITMLLCLICVSPAHAQYTNYTVIQPLDLSGTALEHGFLPGKKFTVYPAIGKYDFSGRKMRVELYDLRDSLHLTKLKCADVELSNNSEFAGPAGAQAVRRYFGQLMPQVNILLDSAAPDTLKVYLEAMDSRLLGFGSITAHGLCQMRMKYADNSQTYCVDITDKDPHSPVSSHAFVTRKTATRVIMSAAIRETIEKFLIDLKSAD